jgi:hypothetical protein
MLFDRNQRLTTISDKLAVRDYISEKIGNKYLIPLLWHGDSPKEISFSELPNSFVIKTNHGCGYVIIVDDKNKIDMAQVRRKLEKWLNINFGRDKYLGIAWGYNHIRPAILIESFIGKMGKTPVDYKFYCFGGHVEFATLHYDRFAEHKTRSFDRDFHPYDFKYDFESWHGPCSRPSNYEEMISIAETLSSEFDFMRVDLYSSDNDIFFSELTPYPGGVSTKFLPRQRDYILGGKWPSVHHRNA